MTKTTALVVIGATLAASCATSLAPRTAPPLRGIYGGVPQEILDKGVRLRDFGIDAVWLGSGSFTPERLALLRAEGVQAYAEFNTLHVADYLKEHPDAAPIGADGRVSPPPQGWQGICPTHDAYRRFRMDAFRAPLRDFQIDGVWLDYHHSHASWERAEPDMPDTCFCDRCLQRFQEATAIRLPDGPRPELAALLLSDIGTAWIRWRLMVFTDWVREFREILDATRPSVLLGTFHNAWSDEDMGGARLEKLAIDLKAQAGYVDVFSPMAYHARFGHAEIRRGSHVRSRGSPISGHRRHAGRAASHLADRASVRLGRVRACRRRGDGARTRRPPPCHRGDGLRVGWRPKQPTRSRRSVAHSARWTAEARSPSDRHASVQGSRVTVRIEQSSGPGSPSTRRALPSSPCRAAPLRWQ